MYCEKIKKFFKNKYIKKFIKSLNKLIKNIKKYTLKYENIIQLSLILYVVVNILYILICSVFRTYVIINYERFSLGYKTFLNINIIISIILLIIRILHKNYKKNILDILLIMLIIFGWISTYYAYDYGYSLYGFKGRYEGFIQIAYYLTMVFITSFINKKYKKAIIFTILFTGIIQTIYALLQVTDLLPFLDIRGRGITLAKGFITNSNFFGSYMVICLSYSIGLFMDEKKKIKKLIFLLLALLFIIGLLISNALSGVVGLIAVLIYLIIYSIKNKYYQKLIIILLLIISVFLLLTKLNKTVIGNDLKKTGNEVTEIAKGNLDDTFGTKRMYVWKNTMKVVPKYLLHGIGIDCFYYLFDGKPLTYYNGRVFYDKAHNEYLQILVTQGIFSLISYLCFYIILIIKGIKNSFKNKQLFFILPVGGYLVQAFFNISVIEVAPLFYIACGLLIDRNVVN